MGSNKVAPQNSLWMSTWDIRGVSVQQDGWRVCYSHSPAWGCQEKMFHDKKKNASTVAKFSLKKQYHTEFFSAWWYKHLPTFPNRVEHRKLNLPMILAEIVGVIYPDFCTASIVLSKPWSLVGLASTARTLWDVNDAVLNRTSQDSDNFWWWLGFFPYQG